MLCVVLESLFTHAMQAHARKDVKALVVTGGQGTFCAGFDINQFVASNANGAGIDDGRINNALVELLEDGPKPSVAAIQGVALGGGCEVALACNARVATPGTSMGLPELQLGIIPGFGGTQRLPRVVGLSKAIEMMLTSKPVRINENTDLVDVVVRSPDELLLAAKKLALDIAEGRAARMKSLLRSDRLDGFGECMAVIEFARREAKKRARGLQHPLLCLDAVQYGIEHGGLAGLRKEGECFAAAASLDTHKALVHIFFAQRATKKVAGITDRGLTPRRVNKIAVLGGGLMGSGIATACILAGHEVIIKEINEKFMQAGLSRVKSNVMSRVKKGKMSQQAAERALGLLKGSITYNEFKNVDMVIEAVIEDIGLKQRIFSELASICPPHAILSTNTSTIDVELIGAKVPKEAQRRIVGAHFFSPAHVMPLLEIVRTSISSPQVVLDTIHFGSGIKKTPVVVGNCTGFAVNRVFFPYTQAACLLADIGLDPYLIDKAIAGFGMPMGPFRLSDLVGADIGFHVGKNFLDSFPERCYPARIIVMLNERKRLGEKTGSGFYKFGPGRKASPDPELDTILQESRAASGFNSKDIFASLGTSKFSVNDIIEFIMFPVVNEGCRVIAEGIVDKPADLDIASVMSMGFPAPRGGLIFWADLVGAEYINRKLEEWATAFASMGLSGFFAPCEYLKSAARRGTKLEAGVTTPSKL